MMGHMTRKKSLKVLVCGGRNFKDRAKLDHVLNDIYDDHGISEIVHGAAPGADTLAGLWAEAKAGKVEVTTFPADWVKYGNRAGPVRNTEMLKKSMPDLVVAFPMRESKGTWDMVKKARAAGVEVMVVE